MIVISVPIYHFFVQHIYPKILQLLAKRNDFGFVNVYLRQLTMTFHYVFFFLFYFFFSF